MSESLSPIAAALDLYRAQKDGPAGIAVRQQACLAKLVVLARERSPYDRRACRGLPSGVSDPRAIP